MIIFRQNIEALRYAQDARFRPALFKRWTHYDNNISLINTDD